MTKDPTSDGMCDLVRMMGWSKRGSRNAVLLFYKLPYERNENKLLAKVTLKGIKTVPAYNSSNEKEVLEIAGMVFSNKMPKFKRRLDEINKNKKEKVVNKDLKRN